MTQQELSDELNHKFCFWRAYEKHYAIFVKIADGPISTSQMLPAHMMKPAGVPIHFETYSWFVRKLFHFGILKNRVFKTELEVIQRKLKWLRALNLFFFVVNASFMVWDVTQKNAFGAAFSGFACGFCITSNFNDVLDLFRGKK